MRLSIVLCAALIAGLPFGQVLGQGLSQGFNSDGTENLSDGTVVPEEGLDGSDIDLPDDIATQPENLVDAPKALLRGLDTLTNTVNDFEIEVGQTLAFKRLYVTLDACLYPNNDPGSEAYAFLRIRDEREDTARFSGWMLASSPALSALDHPRYDIWVLSCKTS